MLQICSFILTMALFAPIITKKMHVV